MQVGVAKHARPSSCVQRTPQQKLQKPISNPTKANAPKRHETLSHHDTKLFVTASSLVEEPRRSSCSCTTSSIARPKHDTGSPLFPCHAAIGFRNGALHQGVESSGCTKAANCTRSVLGYSLFCCCAVHGQLLCLQQQLVSWSHQQQLVQDRPWGARSHFQMCGPTHFASAGRHCQGRTRHDIRLLQHCVSDSTGMFAHALYQDYKGVVYLLARIAFTGY